MKKSKQAELIAHIARVEGQLAAVRKALEFDDCSKAARTMMAAVRSLQSARATCVECFMRERVYKDSRVMDAELLDDVHALMKA